MWPKRDWTKIRQHLGIMLILTLAGITIYNSMAYWGLQYTQAINALLITSAHPLLVASFAKYAQADAVVRAFVEKYQDETDARVRKLYETHLAMEIEHLRVACELMKRVERRDPQAILPLTEFTEPLRFKPNKAYVLAVLAAQIDLTAKDSDFVPVATLPEDDRYFAYQKRVNGDWSPTEDVIRANKEKNGCDYRLETEGPNPVDGLRSDDERDGAQTDYAQRQQAAA